TNSAMPRSSDMAPQFAAGDAADRGAGHTVASADGSGAPACRHGGADLHHVRDGEFGTGVALAADAFRPLVAPVIGAGRGPALPSHVRHVLVVGPEKKVLGVAAEPHVAPVANAHPVRDRTDVLAVGHAVSAIHLARDLHEAVAIDGPGALPDPTACVIDD